MNPEEYKPREYRTEYEEIDVTNYIKVIRKRKRLILGLFLVVVIAAGVYSFSAPKVYKIETTLEVGKIGGQIIEEPGQIVEKIKNDVYGISVREKLKTTASEYPEIKVENPEDTGLVIIEIKSSQPELAKNILEEINSLILEEHQEKIENKKELIEKDIERLKTKTNSLEEEKKNLEAKVEALEQTLLYYQTPGSQFALFDTKEKLENKKQEIEDLYLRINSSQRSLEDIRFTGVVKNPTISESPVAPNPLLNIVIASALGIFIGVFLAFGKEWWEKSKV